MNGIILAGGFSRRMGKPKALLPYKQMTLIEWLSLQLQKECSQITIVTNELLYPDIKTAVNNSSQTYTVVVDIPKYKGLGPIAGIFSGISQTPTHISQNHMEFGIATVVSNNAKSKPNPKPVVHNESNQKNESIISDDLFAVVACDMPFVNMNLIRRMANLAVQSDDLDAVLIQNQPLHAIYHRRILPYAQKCLDTQQLRLQQFLQNLKTYEILPKTLSEQEQHAFININTPEEYALLQAQAQAESDSVF